MYISCTQTHICRFILIYNYFPEGVKLLNENGVKQDPMEDLNTENEKVILFLY